MMGQAEFLSRIRAVVADGYVLSMFKRFLQVIHVRMYTRGAAHAQRPMTLRYTTFRYTIDSVSETVRHSHSRATCLVSP